MAAQNTRSFGREAVAVYLAAALVVFGTWAASRYLILRKFENIEQNEVSRSIEVMRKALVTKNTEIETVSRDFARWDDMYSYVSTLDANFEYQNFSEAGLDEMNVDLVWLLDPKEKLLSSFENDTDDARYRHPASDAVIAEINRLTPIVRTVLDQEGTLRLVQINGVPHVIAAHTVLRSDRSGPPGGTLVFARRIGAPEIASIGADTQLNVNFAHARRSRGRGREGRSAGRAGWPPHPAPLGQPHRRPVAPRHHRQSSARGAVHHAAALGDAERPAGRALSRRLGRVARQHRGRRLARLQRPARAAPPLPRPRAKPAIAPSSNAPRRASCCSIRLRAAFSMRIRRRSV